MVSIAKRQKFALIRKNTLYDFKGVLYKMNKKILEPKFKSTTYRTI